MAELTRKHRTPNRVALAAVAIGVAGGLIVLCLARISGGWAPLAPDDARYLFVGLSVLDGQGAVTPSGNPYLLRSPVYGVALAIGSRLLGGDPLIGAHLVALAASLLGLLAAVRLAWLIAGPGGAVGTALALTATPLIWQLLPSLRIDLPQTALVLAILLVARRPTIRRWAVAGVLLGLVVLVKETVLPLVFLPVALVGLVPPATLRRLALAYVVCAIATAAWWWAVVWAARGQLFPANALAAVEARDVEGAYRLTRAMLPLLVAFVVGWGVVVWRARQELGARLLVAAAIGLAPATLYAALQSLNARNFAGLAVLSAITVGVAGATLVAAIRPWLARRSGRSVMSRAGAALCLAAVVAFTLAGPTLGQRSITRTETDVLADSLVAWIAENVPDGGRIVMAFREREETALRRFGRTDVGPLGAKRVELSEPPSEYIWMGLRGEQLFGYPRSGWITALTDPPASYLVLVSPHPFTPVDLLGASDGGSSVPGLAPVVSLEGEDDRADIFRIDAQLVRDQTNEVPLHLTTDAAMVWLDQAGGSDAVGRLLDARPVVSGEAVEGLLARLGAQACRTPKPDGAVQLGPAGTCPS